MFLWPTANEMGSVANDECTAIAEPELVKCEQPREINCSTKLHEREKNLAATNDQRISRTSIAFRNNIKVSQP